jgi:hypothetical protein
MIADLPKIDLRKVVRFAFQLLQAYDIGLALL